MQGLEDVEGSNDNTDLALAYGESVVAVDLGSNSFHLLQARQGPGTSLLALSTKVCKVQLGLDMQDRQLSTAAIARGLACLHDFASYTRSTPAGRVRIVGTQALRIAANRQAFIDPAMEILGQSIDIISGAEEAELAYLGVGAAGVGPAKDQPQLVVDIGGGSTEFAVGCGPAMQQCQSVAVGCVTLLAHFPGGAINVSGFEAAYQGACRSFIGPAKKLAGAWQLSVGCSGTLLAIEQVLMAQGWCASGISRSALYQLKAALLAFDSVEAVRFQGLHEDRRSIFASGLAIVLALFDSFAIEAMALSPSGLREGLAWQLAYSGQSA